MKLMTPFGKTKMESHGKAFEPSSAMFIRRFLDKKGYLEKSWRWFRVKNQMVPSRWVAEKVELLIFFVGIDLELGIMAAS